MLSRLQRIFLSVGIGVCLVAVLFFVCSMQQQRNEILLQKQAVESAGTRLAIYLNLPTETKNSFSYRSLDNTLVANIMQATENELIISPVVQDTHSLTAALNGETDTASSMLGVSQHYAEAAGLSVVWGNFFTQEQCDNAENVCAVSRAFLNYYGIKNPEEATVTVNGETMRVVSTFEKTVETSVFANSALGNEQLILLPAATLTRLQNEALGTANNEAISYLLAKPVQPTAAKSLAEYANALTEKLVPYSTETDATLTATPLYQLTSAYRAGTDGLLATAAAVSALLMVLAGLNVIQVATAAVQDHRKQIALKLAVGASPGAICRELLQELAVLCLKAGYFGLTAAALCILFFNRQAERTLLTFNFTTVAVVLLGIFCMLGVSFLLPAYAVFRLEPAEALRGE